MQEATRYTVLWLKRDLRLHDHRALCVAAELGRPILPLYVIEPEAWQLPTASSRHYAFMGGALGGLHEALKSRGGALCIRVGGAVNVLRGLRDQLGTFDMVSHEEVGESWSFARDLRVARWCREHSIEWHEVQGCGVVRRLSTRDYWQGLYTRYMSAPTLPVPAGMTWAQLPSDPLPRWADLSNRAVLPAVPILASRRAALARLDRFLNEGAQTYQADMSTPLKAPAACSRLSEYFAWGILSTREAGHALGRTIPPEPRQEFAKGYRSFRARLAWRDHFIQKLEDMPDLDQRAMHSGYEGLRPRGSYPDRLAAFADGQTGVPFVDAGMRCLRATGWINFRARAMLMSFAAYHLWLNWRDVGEILAQYFIDYEPGIHWSQVQMQAGVTGMNTFRIYNPMKQGVDQDSNGQFTRHWVPELREVPREILHNPPRDVRRQVGYPAPLVDVEQAAKQAREVMWGLRASLKGAAQTRAVIEKHASRKRTSKGQLRKKAQQSQQLRFDF